MSKWLFLHFIFLVFLLLGTSAQAVTLATWNAKHLGWGTKRDWSATAAVVAPYDFIALSGSHE